MATLTIPDLPEPLYRALVEAARRERRTVEEQARHLLAQGLPAQAEHSLLDLEGPGAELWAGVDATEYVRRERESWD